MSIYWFARQLRYAVQPLFAIAVLAPCCLFSQTRVRPVLQGAQSCPAGNGQIMARKLVQKADIWRAESEVVRGDKDDVWRATEDAVRAYLLYAEAAKCDPAVLEYRNKRDSLAPVAKLMLKAKVVQPHITDDVASALRETEVEDRRLGPAPALKTRNGASAFASAFAPSGSDKATAAAPQLPGPLPPVPGTQPGQVPDIPQPDAKPESQRAIHFSYIARLLGYGTYQDVRGNSVFNPQNKLAGLPFDDFHGALRTDIQLSFSIFSFMAKPRVDYDRTLQSTTNHVNGYMQEWTARVKPIKSLTLSYGREVLLWGPSMSVPASNPFFTDNGRNTPLLEVGARDFARAVWQPDSHLSVSYIVNTGLARGNPGFVPFQKTAALKVDYSTHSLLFSGIYSSRLNNPLGDSKFVGGYMQGSLGQAVRIYVEGSAQQQNPGLYPQVANSALGWSLSQTQYYSSLRPRTIVGGLAYTDVKGGTWTGEYIYNPFGYTSMFASNYFNMGQDLSSLFLQGGQNTQAAALILANARQPGDGLLRRNYAFAQYQRNGLGGHFDVVLRYTLSADDRSGQSVAYLTWNASDHIQLFTVLAGMNGAADTEFSRYLHYQAQLGFRLFFH